MSILISQSSVTVNDKLRVIKREVTALVVTFNELKTETKIQDILLKANVYVGSSLLVETGKPLNEL